ncbi:Dolichyl-phosphate-mannose-protein mannosyltransferase [uncultured archaeon]|nr:Dolichyl-phosphate-mannose-protein mannosyltransferase [uncultured archaeon]
MPIKTPKRSGKKESSLAGKIIYSKYFFHFCAAAAITIRLFWILLVDAQPTGCFKLYYESGLNAAASRLGYSTAGQPTAFLPIGYPILLGLTFAVFGPSLLAAKLMNLLLYLGVIAASYFIAKKLFKSETIGRLTFLVLSFYPNHVAYVSLTATEILFLFLSLAGMIPLLYRKRQVSAWLLSGAIFGFATLVKPYAIGFLALFLLDVWIRGDAGVSRRRSLVLFSAGTAALILVLLPWIARNYVVNHEVVLLSDGGTNLLIGNNPYATGTYLWDDKVKALIGISGDIQQDNGTASSLESACEEAVQDTAGEYERDVKARDYAINYMRDNPVGTLALWPKKLFYSYWSEVDGATWNLASVSKPTGFVRGFLLFFGVVSSLAYYAVVLMFLWCLRMFAGESEKRSFPILGLIVVAYFTLWSLVFFGDLRYHFSVIPWVVMYAASAAEPYVRR